MDTTTKFDCKMTTVATIIVIILIIKSSFMHTPTHTGVTAISQKTLDRAVQPLIPTHHRCKMFVPDAIPDPNQRNH